MPEDGAVYKVLRAKRENEGINIQTHASQKQSM